VDTLEHGMGLDADLLDRMAEEGTALTPTLSVLTASLVHIQKRPDSSRKRWYVEGATTHPALTAAAAEAGVTLLAGTDSRPHGQIADEVRALAAAGVPSHAALGAASWAARSYLGWPGLTAGGPADVVVYASDPRADLAPARPPIGCGPARRPRQVRHNPRGERVAPLGGAPGRTGRRRPTGRESPVLGSPTAA
jgi:imidazolonepropionase-like amidohydrolase